MDAVLKLVRVLPPAGSWFVAALTFFCALFRYDLVEQVAQVSNTNNLAHTYDYIIIGGGTAGCVIANRLSENSNRTVLILEAGGQESLNGQIPTLYGTLGDLDWKYPMSPQPDACYGLVGGTCVISRGKVIGGTSSIGSMFHTRGNRRDFDRWQELGNTGWSFEDVLPYFIKSEDQLNKEYAENTKYHSTGGYLTLTEPPFRLPIVEYFLKGGKEMGYDYIDVNGDRQTGFTYVQRTMRNGARLSAAQAFLRPAKDRKNLHISLYSHVLKIIFDERRKRAEGVHFLKNGQELRINARREIILSAGTISSPQILMLSGAGPKNHLREHNIHTSIDLPGVGQNMQDKLSFSGLTFLVNDSVTFLANRYKTIDAINEYAMFGTGPLSTTIGSGTIAFLPSKYADNATDYPDIQLDLVGSHPSSFGVSTTENFGGPPKEMSQRVYGPMSLRDGYSVYPTVLRPKSIGSIRLKSSNPFEYPIINQNYMSHPDDVLLIVEAAKTAILLSQTPSMKRIGATLNPNKVPGCENFTLASDRYWECAARRYTGAIYHSVGTCKMGPRNDPMAVVDSQLRVHGVYGLRVADASVMPTIVNANVMATVYMIGEKVSDMIKEAESQNFPQDLDWKFPRPWQQQGSWYSYATREPIH